ncbi:Plasmid transfer protein [Erwinia rhapontici]|uniref:hypothetical protein n=1 Tax=Erwinia rhapontici TaxID=55212 RepID=UPI003D36A918
MTTETLPDSEPALDPNPTEPASSESVPPVRHQMFAIGNPLIFKRVALGVAAIFIIAPCVLSLVLSRQVSNMDIRLNSLEAAFRSGHLSQLSTSVAALEKQVAEQEERFAPKTTVVEGLKGIANSLDEQFSGKNEKQNEKIVQLESQINEQKRSLLDALNESQARDLAFSTLKASVDTLKARWGDKPVTTASGNTVSSAQKSKTLNSKKSLRSARPAPLAAPFILTGIEQRGGQMFAVVVPRGATSLSQMQLLSPGDHAWGWQLRRIEGNEALFSVNGISQRLTAQ